MLTCSTTRAARPADVLEQEELSPCELTQLNCTSESIFDYAAFHFCTMYEAGLEWLSFILLVRPLSRGAGPAHVHRPHPASLVHNRAQFLWLGVIFVAVGTSADEFLVPSLEVISTTLKLTQNVAGVRVPGTQTDAALGAHLSPSRPLPLSALRRLSR